VISKGNFELRNGRNGARITTKDMVDYLAIKKHLEERKISFYTFFSKSLKPIKAIIRQLPGNTPAEDIVKELQSIGFDVISVRQLISRNTQAPINLPLFLVTLPRNDKAQEIFQLSSLNHVIIKVEAYRAQTGLTQCYNCQQFGHIWVNCKQPPKCVWCGGGHLHKECPEKEKENSKPTCSNCKLEEGEKPHPSNYRGCKTAKELQKKKTQLPHAKETTDRVITTRLVTPNVSFAEALKGKERVQPQQLQQQHQPTTGGDEKKEDNRREQKQRGQQPEEPKEESGQTRQVQHHPDKEGEGKKGSNRKEKIHPGQQPGNKQKSTMDNMFKVINVVQQIMAGLNESVSEEDKIMTITKIVLNLINEQ